jgi:hypothetical protein
VASGGVAIENSPFSFVTTPWELPLTFTEAPGSGPLLSSVMVPVTFTFWATDGKTASKAMKAMTIFCME